MRCLILVGAELRQVRSALPYTLLTILSPVMFMALFMLMVRGDITLPLTVHPGPDRSEFAQVLATNRAPGNPPYLQVEPGTADPPRGESTDLVVIAAEPTARDGRPSGTIVHYVNDVNTNMTKNFRNRLTGAVYTWSSAHLEGGDVGVEEHPTYPRDIPWSTTFGLSALGFGALFSGLLFGLLSMTREWERGTILWLRLAPTRPGLVIAAKLSACLVQCSVAGVVLVGVLRLLTGLSPARPLPLAGGLALGYLASSAFGLMVGFASRNTLTSFLTSLVTALVCWVGGGGLGPMFVFGPAAVALSRFNPATHIIDLARWSYLGGRLRPQAALTALAVTAVVGVLGATGLYLARLRRPEASS